MKLFSTTAAILALTAAALSAPAHAQFAKAEEAVKYRQGSWFVLGQHFGRLGAMAQGKVAFDAKAAEENAAIVLSLSKLPMAGFGAGTEGGKAKAAIWKEQAKFQEYGQKFSTAITALDAAAKTGNLDNFKAAFGEAANTCKTCHDAYRSK